MITIENRNYCEKCYEILTQSNYATHSCYNSNMITKPEALIEGTMLAGKYIVGSVIGKGGFGITYIGFDLTQKRRVAIKEFFPEHCAHRTPGTKDVIVTSDHNQYNIGVTKFYKEAKMLGAFSESPNIVHVLNFFKENNTAYIVMEYLEGCDLKEHFKTLPEVEENYIIFLAIETLKSLSLLHGKKIYHRDISPDNIFLCNNGYLKLIDFGSARVASTTYSVLLKPGFAPMELYMTKGNQGPWTDIYELGATLYYLLKRKVIDDAPARMSSDVLDFSGVSPSLAYVITKMLAVKIEHRYRNATEVINDLVAIQKGEVPGISTTSRRTAEQPQVQRSQTDIVSAPEKEEFPNSVVVERIDNTNGSSGFGDRLKNDVTTRTLFIIACVTGGILAMGLSIISAIAFFSLL